jgi:tetratricopeptide (TPR) repeat protein
MLTLLFSGPTLADRPAFEPLLQRAEKALAEKDLETAVILYEKLANFYPESSLAHNRLGYAHYLKGNDPRAIYSFRKALALSRSNDQALHNLLLASGRQADGLARENAFAESERELDDLISAYSWHPQHAVLLYYRGRMEFLRGKPDAGLEWWRRAAAQAPGSGVSKVVAAQSRPLDDATIALYGEANKKVKSEPAFDYLLGMRHLEAKQYEPAYQSLIKGLEKSREADIPFPLLSLKAAQTAMATGRVPEAIQILEEAKKQRPDWSSVRSLLWPAYLMAGNPTAADQALQESFELDARPKLAVIGAPDQPVRLTTRNGSLLLVPPTGLSIPTGTHKLFTSDGSEQQLAVSDNQAFVYRVSPTGLTLESTATLASNTGNAGQLAPPLVAKDRRGRFYRLAESLLKKPIVILFWRVSDSDANDQLSRLGAIASRFGDGVETVAVHVDPSIQKDAQRLYLSQPGTSAQLWGDPEIAKEFGVTEFPALAVIDSNGRITLLRTGPASVLFNDINDYLETL